MGRRLRSKLSYANVMATLAVFLVLSGGTAVALNGSNTVQSDDLGPGAQVKAADVADNAVNGADVVNDSLGGADVNESSLGLVPNAAHSTNSSQLGGRAATAYQRRVTESCAGGAIRSIGGNGGVSCTDQVVFPISADLDSTGNRSKSTSFFPSELGMLMRCDSSSGAADFINHGLGGATLNWLFSEGQNFPTSTVNASGTSVPGQNGQNVTSFNFAKRLEGQWIFADAAGVTTVNLHAFIAPGSPAFCEFKGTAEFAPR